MIRRPPKSTRNAPPFPYTPLFRVTEARSLCSWGREAHGGRARYDIRHYALALMAKRRSSRQHHGFVRVRDDRRGGRAEVAGQDLHIGRTMSEEIGRAHV